MTNIFSSIAHFFEKLFGPNANSFQTVFTRISDLINKALPIVADVALVVEGIDFGNQTAILNAVSKYLPTVISDAEAVAAWLTVNSSVPVPNMLHNVAVFVLDHTHGLANTLLSDLDSAVQVAYSVFKVKATTPIK